MKINWRYVAEFIAVSSVVLSLIFVGVELRLSRAAAEVAMSTTLDSNNLELRTLISENADIWYRGCEGESLTNEEKVIFTSLFHATYFNLMTRWSINNAGVVDRPLEGPARRIAVSRLRYPGFSETFDNFLEAGRNPVTDRTGPVNLFTLVDSIYEELPEAGLLLDIGAEFCGM